MDLQLPRSSGCVSNSSLVIRHVPTELCVNSDDCSYNSYGRAFFFNPLRSRLSPFRAIWDRLLSVWSINFIWRLSPYHKSRYPLQVLCHWSWQPSLLPPHDSSLSPPFLWYYIRFWACWNMYLLITFISLERA